MKRLLPRKLPILLLGAFLALGMALSAVHANDFAMTIAAGSELCLPGQTGGAGCDTGDHEESTLSSCESVCTVTTIAVLSAGPEFIMAGSADPQPPAQQIAAGISFSPDPFPPRG